MAAKKLEAAAARLDEVKDSPALFASCSMVVTEDLRPIRPALTPSRPVGFFNAMIQNVAPGHTQVFNRAPLELLRADDPGGAPMVDWWVYLTTTGCATSQEAAAGIRTRTATGCAISQKAAAGIRMRTATGSATAAVGCPADGSAGSLGQRPGIRSVETTGAAPGRTAVCRWEPGTAFGIRRGGRTDLAVDAIDNGRGYYAQ